MKSFLASFFNYALQSFKVQEGALGWIGLGWFWLDLEETELLMFGGSMAIFDFDSKVAIILRFWEAMATLDLEKDLGLVWKRIFLYKRFLFSLSFSFSWLGNYS